MNCRIRNAQATSGTKRCGPVLKALRFGKRRAASHKLNPHESNPFSVIVFGARAAPSTNTEVETRYELFDQLTNEPTQTQRQKLASREAAKGTTLGLMAAHTGLSW